MEMHSKTTVQYHIILIRMAIIKKKKDDKYWQEYREKGTLLYCWLECKMVWLLGERVWRFLKKLIIEIQYSQQSHFWVYIQKN